MMPVTGALLIANVMFLLQQFSGSLEYLFALWPPAHDSIYGGGYAGPQFQPWQLVTYAFLHGGFAHLFFNMFALWMFGPEIERLLNSSRFATYYLTCAVGGALAHLAWIELTDGPVVPVVGASGATFGLLLAFALAFPKRKLLLLFPPIPMPAWLFVTLYAAVELYSGATNTAQGIAHFVHLGGAFAGFLLIVWWRRQSAAR